MRCISPILVRSSTTRNYVPCGKCNFCLASKRSDWSLRLANELKQASTAKFITLTYSDNQIPRNPDTGMTTFSKPDLQLFMKRLRKRVAKVSGIPLRFYTVAEYGSHTFRPHYHSIMFNIPLQVIAELPKIWDKGHVHVGDVTDASINYVTKYVINRMSTDLEGRDPPFSIMSTRPGIGANYLDKAKRWHINGLKNYMVHNGEKRKLPRYYKDKIFSKSQKKRMADESLAMADVVYHGEVSRLAGMHNNPEAYIEERERFAHDHVHNKLNQNDKF